MLPSASISVGAVQQAEPRRADQEAAEQEAEDPGSRIRSATNGPIAITISSRSRFQTSDDGSCTTHPLATPAEARRTA